MKTFPVTALLLLVSATLVLASPQLRQEAPAAVVVKVTGDVQVRPASGEPRAAGVGTRLSIGDQVVPGEGGSAVVVARSGQRQVVDATVTIQEPEGSDGDMFSRTVAVLAQAASSDARSAPNRQGMIRPLPGEPGKVSPRNGIRILDTRPTFTWFAVPGAEEYTVQVRRAGASPVRFSTRDTVLTLPEDAALEPGHTYYWTVAAGRRVGREDSLVVAAPELRKTLDSAMGQIRAMGFDPADDGRLLSAIVYADTGLYYRALDELDALAAGGTPLAADAWLLRGEILDALGRLEEARAAFDMADRLLR